MGGIDVAQVRSAMVRVAQALATNKDRLTELDQAMGDGDLGITAAKLASALNSYAEAEPSEDVGTYVSQAGIAVNRAASSSLGTLLATALMRAGKEVRGRGEVSLGDLARMLSAADSGVQERGKAKPGDKTVIDVLHPAAEALAAAAAEGATPGIAAKRTLQAARAGRDSVTPRRSRIGRAGWVGERTEGLVDPGCEAGLVILAAIVGRSPGREG